MSLVPARRRTRTLGRIAGLATVTAFIGTVSVPGVASSMRSARPDASDAADGAELYATQCVSCHGPDGGGVDGRGPTLRVEGPAAVDFVLRTGRMPMADPGKQATRRPVRYTDLEIAALVDYIGGLGTGPAIPDVDPSAGDVANGGTLFRLNCAACHVATGSGSVIGGDRRAPALDRSTPTQVGEAIVTGPGAMPVFGQLSPADIDDIAGYLEALRAENPTGPRSLGGVGPVAEGLGAWLLALVPLVALTRWIGSVRTDTEPGTPTSSPIPPEPLR